MADEKKIEDRGWYLASIDRLMAPGVRLPPRAADWLTVQRNKFFLEPNATPGGGLRDRMRRLLCEAGLERRRPLPRPFCERGMRAPEGPHASSPAALWGSREATPMAPWLVTGQGVPLRPPPRRAVSP